MKGSRGLLYVAIALIVAGILFFFFGSRGGKEDVQKPAVQETEKREAPGLAERPEEAGEEVSAEKAAEKEAEKEAGDISTRGAIGRATAVGEDECERMEKEVKEFFAYLDGKDYIKELKIGEDMFTHFKKVVHLLSENPPIPAGEGLKQDTMIRNIFHFYRVLGFRDLTLILRILRNEADTLELNLASLYQWLMSAEQCDQKDGLPPSLDIVYRYAGFLVNSIGGRSYLFRRETRLRLLVNYYCLLIIHEADKRKMNSFGIDITPFLEPLAEEIEHYRFLYYRKEYAGKLIDLKNYYLKRRRAS
jgi:hypothetical protein